MKKIFLKTIIILILIILLGITISAVTKNIRNNKSEENILENQEVETEKLDSVTYNGWIQTNGYKLLNQKGKEIQLRGISSHGIEWFGDLITKENLEKLKNEWQINVFRIAMYTDVEGQGYVNNKEKNKEILYNIVDMAIDLDMYVIVDWHILKDNTPQIHKEEAKIFFDEISKKYSNNPNVIYEICNEPNGSNVKWENDIKPYAEEIIPIIRKNSKKSLIIVGTPNWCLDIIEVANNPLNFENVVYSCHFYAGNHRSEIRERINECIEKNIPIFISECGLTDANGNGQIYEDSFNEWIEFLNRKKISWIYWSFANKDESSSLLTREYSPKNEKGEPNNIDNYLTEAGYILKGIFKSYNQ